MHSGWHARNAHLPARVQEAHSETAYTTDQAIRFVREHCSRPWMQHMDARAGMSMGTELTTVQQSTPAKIPAGGRYLGWQDALQLLTLLTAPKIPG